MKRQIERIVYTILMNVRFATSKDKKAVLALMDELGEEINRARGYSPHNTEATRVGGSMFDEIISRRDTMIFVKDVSV